MPTKLIYDLLVKQMPLTFFSEALQTIPTRALIIWKACDSHAKNVVVLYTPKNPSLCLLKLISQKVNIQKFEVKRK
jgi:hypothetical protein